MLESSNSVAAINQALWFIIGVSLFLTAAITAVMIYFVVRYSRKRHPVAAQIEGNMPLEIVWSIVPLLVSLWMFQLGWDSFMVFRSVPDGAMEIDVYAQQFRWDFEYPNGKRSVSELVLPMGAPVRLDLHSRDVNHSFFIPDFQVKEDVIPGLNNYLAFTPIKTGIFDIFCAEYCGLNHSGMLARLEVKSPREFYDWYNRAQAQEPVVIEEMTRGSPEQLARGAQIFRLQCASCHGEDGDGSPLPAARDLTSLEDWKNDSTLSAVFRTVTRGIPDTQMAGFAHFRVDDRFAVAHHVRKFAEDKGIEHPVDAPGELAALDEEFSLSAGAERKPEISIDLAIERMVEESKPQAPSEAPPQ